MTLRVDFHVHLSRFEHLQPWVQEWMETFHHGERGLRPVLDEYITRWGVAALRRLLGVDVIVGQADMSMLCTATTTNEFVGELCQGVEGVGPFCNINPYLVGQPGRELERLVRDYGFRGVKLQPSYQYFYPNDRMLYALYATAEELRIPAMFHTGSSIFRGARIKYAEPIHLDDVAVDFPDLTIVMAHSGRGFWYDQAFFLARIHPNVYMEIAGLPPQRLLDYFPDLERNAEKVIYGSDWPGVPDPRQNIAAVESLPLGPRAKELILGGNAARILRLAAP
ncbi:MAG: amidohydrolase [Chloroflexi bacterium]|nr:amidohydrolase [Chloroflexota bacterium]